MLQGQTVEVYSLILGKHVRDDFNQYPGTLVKHSIHRKKLVSLTGGGGEIR